MLAVEQRVSRHVNYRPPPTSRKERCGASQKPRKSDPAAGELGEQGRGLLRGALEAWQAVLPP